VTSTADAADPAGTSRAAGDQTPTGSAAAGLVGAAVAVGAWGTGSVLAKAITMGGLAIAVYRFLLHFAALALWMRIRGAPFTLTAARRSWWGGLALGADVAFFFSAVKLTSVINATLIGALQPVLVGVVAARFFGERIRGRDALWSIVALAGVVGVIVGGGDGGVSDWRGDLLAVGALICWSAYFIASKQSRGRMTTTEFTAGSAMWTGLLNLPLALAFGQDLSFPDQRDLILILAMLLVAGVFGHSAMNWSLVQIPLWVGSTFTLLIPVAASIMAWLVLDEPLNATQISCTALVLASLAAIAIRQSRPNRPLTTVSSPPE
jgi:drug/metabolite transporter (DMT)-like permease